MKVSLPKSISNQAVNKKPLLPLIPDEEDVLTKDNSNKTQLYQYVYQHEIYQYFPNYYLQDQL